MVLFVLHCLIVKSFVLPSLSRFIIFNYRHQSHSIRYKTVFTEIIYDSFAHLNSPTSGAGQDVGRSCILLQMGGKNIMLDCGMHMGYNDEV